MTAAFVLQYIVRSPALSLQRVLSGKRYHPSDTWAPCHQPKGVSARGTTGGPRGRGRGIAPCFVEVITCRTEAATGGHPARRVGPPLARPTSGSLMSPIPLAPAANCSPKAEGVGPAACSRAACWK